MGGISGSSIIFPLETGGGLEIVIIELFIEAIADNMIVPKM
jgi:hypothetical protein